MSQMLNVRVPDELFAKIDAAAADAATSRTEVVVALLVDSLAHREQQLAMLTERIMADRAELFARLR